MNVPYPSPALLNPSVNKFYPQLNKLETFQFHLQVGNTVEYWFYVLLSNSVKSTAKLSWIEFAVLATNPACQPFNIYNQVAYNPVLKTTSMVVFRFHQSEAQLIYKLTTPISKNLKKI